MENALFPTASHPSDIGLALLYKRAGQTELGNPVLRLNSQRQNPQNQNNFTEILLKGESFFLMRLSAAQEVVILNSRKINLTE